MKHSYLLKNAIGFLNINKLIKVFNVLLFICFSIGLKAQTTSTFASLGANNSGGTGYKTISTNSNLVVENIMENDMTDMYYAGAFNENYTAGPFSIKAYGVTDFTFNGMSFRGYTGLIVDAAHSKVVFKDAGGNTIQTMNLNANKVLGTSSTNLVSFFDNGTTVPIYNVAEIIVEIYQNSDQAYQQNSLNFNYVDITITPSPVNTAPTVTSQALTDVATTTATGNGTISATGGANITERGIYWNLTDGFADGAGTKVSTTGDWSATGAFTQAITGLTPNTTYYVKSFAANSAGTGYGGIESFTTTSVAVLLSSSPTISFSNDTGFSDNIAQDGEGGSTAISDLNLQVMPINSSGVKLSADPLQYHDGSDPLWTSYPAIITYGDTNPLYGWSIKSDDEAEFKLLAVDFLDWGTFSGNTFVIEAFRNGSSLGIATFAGNTTSSYIELRSAGMLTTIFDNVDEVRLFEQGGAGSYISLNNIQVTTPIAETLASVTTTSVSTYDATSATLGGNVTSDGGATVTERGIVYSITDATPTIGESEVTQDINGAGTGLFSKSTSGLAANTTYYVQAYATNSAGTSYGGVESFTTSLAPDPYSQLYWGTYETDKIERINLDGTGREDVVTNASGETHYGVIGFTVDIPNEKVYWFEDANMTIKSASLDGSNVQTIATSVGWTYSVSVDTKNNKLYWTDYNGDKIVRSELDGTNATNVISSASGVTNYGPIGMAVDAVNGKIYWFEDANMTIKSANLDGSDVQTIASSIGWAYSISVDSKNSKVYWTDYEGDKIVRSDLDGSNATIVISSASGVTYYGPIGMTVDAVNEKIYWFEDANQTIKRANFDGTGTETVLTASGWVYSLYIPVELPSPTSPLITTTSISTYDANSATLGGNVTADGGAAVTERGIVYSTTDATPTIGESGVTQDINGAGTGLFSKSTSGLDASTTYYVQAYAINTAGTSYGGVESFTTDIGELIWNGSESTDWETAENWTPATIPNAGYNVTIPTGASNYPTLSSAGACNNLIIESNASSNGSLIGQSYLTVNGSVTVQLYLTGIDKWHLISSSVEGQSIYDFVVNDVATNAVAAIAPKYGLAPYENSTPGWNHFTTAAGTNDISSAGNFIAGKGYEVLRTTDGTLNFTGTLSISDVDIAISKNTNGWNIVGNPYPSAINAANISTNFLSANAAALDGNYEAIYVWDAANSNYITVNNTSGPSYVAPGQAFFVYSVDGGSTISFTEAMQTHQSGDIFKSGDIPSPSIKLIAERSQGASATNILYLENTTTGLDPGYDAGRFSASNNNFAVYTRLVGDETNVVDFDIQCLPVDGFENIIPVGLNAPANTELVFRAETMNLPVGVSVYLEDKLTGGFTALHNPDNFYSVYTDKKTEGTGRFFLHTKSSSTLVDPMLGISGFNVIPLPQNNSLRVIGSFGNNAEITVYDMAGRKLLKSKLNNTEHNEVDMGQLISGFYLVSVSSSAQRVSKKISWVKE